MPRFHVPVPLAGFLALLLSSSLAISPAVADGLNIGVKAITLEDLFPGAVFDPDLPTQVAVTGVEPGQRPLRTDLDEEFWLNYGLDPSISVWFGGNDSMIAEPPVSVAARFPAVDRLANTGYATRETLGRGQVILFAGHPAYRRWVVESERLLLNAILLGPGLGTRWSSPW